MASEVAYLERRKAELGAELTTMVKAREKAAARLEYERKMAIARLERATAEREAELRIMTERRDALAAEIKALDKERFGGKHTSMASISRRICKVFGVTLADLRSHSRSARVVLPRQAVMYWASRRTDGSSAQIGRWLGSRDHSTIIHGRDKYIEKRKEMGRTLRKVR